MTDAVAMLTLDFLRTLEAGPRLYADVIDAWRTSCPRLTVWEDAIDAGLIMRARESSETVVALTILGRQLLATSCPDDPA